MQSTTGLQGEKHWGLWWAARQRGLSCSVSQRCPIPIPGSPFTAAAEQNIALQPGQYPTLVAVSLLWERIMTRIRPDVHGPFFWGEKREFAEDPFWLLLIPH